MGNKNITWIKSMLSKFQKYFISGLMTFLPIALAMYLFVLTIDFADAILGKYIQPYIHKYFGFYFPGLSIIFSVYVIVCLGFFATNFFGKKIYDFFEKILVRLPFFKQVYPALKEMAFFLFSRGRFSSFKKVVIVEYPRKGIYSFGFITNETSEKICKLTNEELCNVFVSSSPSPFTGFVVMCKKKEIITTDITIEDAFKFILSGGVVNPGQVMRDDSF